MSSPFYGPAPVYLPFSGTVDANGNFKAVIMVRAAFWVSGKVVPKLSIGSGQWEVNDGGSIPLGFGRGQRAEIGSIVAPPNASIVLNLTGGVPGAAVSGSFQGVQHPDMGSLASRYAPLPNITTLEQTAVRRRLGTISIGPNSTSPSTTFNLSAETRSVGLQALSAANLTNVNITGAQSGTVYYNTTPADALMEFVFIDFADDTAVNVTITAGAGGTSPQVAFFSVIADDFVKTWIQGSSNNQTVTISGIPVVDVSDRDLRLLGRVRLYSADSLGLFTDGQNNLRVVHGTTAAPTSWQVPNNFAPIDIAAGLAINGAQTLVTGVVNQSVRLFGYHLETDAASAIGIASLEDSTSVVIDKTPLNSVPLGLFVDFKAIVLPVGRGVQLANRGSAATGALRGSLTFDQR